MYGAVVIYTQKQNKLIVSRSDEYRSETNLKTNIFQLIFYLCWFRSTVRCVVWSLSGLVPFSIPLFIRHVGILYIPYIFEVPCLQTKVKPLRWHFLPAHVSFYSFNELLLLIYFHRLHYIIAHKIYYIFICCRGNSSSIDLHDFIRTVCSDLVYVFLLLSR